MQLPGLMTGIDTSEIVNQLINSSKQTLYSYKVQKQKWTDRDAALSELRSILKSFDSAVNGLSDADSLRAFKATSTDSKVLSATAASKGVFEGNHKVEVNQLANSERWVHSGFLFKESLVGSGKFIYSYAHQEITIDTTSQTTLQDLAGLINNDTNNPGVTATILEYDDGSEGVYHLVLSGNDAGSDYQISINSSTTQVLAANSKLEKDGSNATLSTKLTDLDGFSGTLAGTEKITVSGTDFSGNAITGKELNITNDMTVRHLMDRINDAFDGVAKAKFEDGKITLIDNQSGASLTSMSLDFSGSGGDDPASMTLPAFSNSSADGGTQGGQLSNILDPADFHETQAAQDSQIKVDNYPPSVSEIQTLSPTVNPTSGTFTLSYRGQATAAINHNATAADIQTALESLSNIETGDVTVSGTLDAGDIIFTFKDSLGDVSNISIDPTNLDQPDQSNYTVTETQKGQAWISRSSNNLTNVLPGVTLDLLDVGNVQVSVNKDTKNVKSKLNSLISAYNNVKSFIDEKTKYDPETKKAGILISSYTTRTIQNIIRNGVTTPATGFVDGVDEYRRAYEIGLDFKSDGTLSLDESKLDDAIANDYNAVVKMIGAKQIGRTTGTNKDIITFNEVSKHTQPGDYEIEVTTDESGFIGSARIRMVGDTTWRNQSTWNSNGVITMKGKTSTDDQNWLPERDMLVNVNLSSVSPNTTYTAKIHVQQGFTGALAARLDDVLDSSKGYLAIDTDSASDKIKELDRKIEAESKRIDKKKERLTAQFARLERTMLELQSQMAAVSQLATF